MRKLLKFVAMVLGTGLTGGLMAVVVGISSLLLMQGSLLDFGGLAGPVFGILIGYPVGVIIGIFVFWKVFKYGGSFWYGVPASLLGAVIPIALAEVFSLNTSALWVFVFFFALSPLLGTVGFHLGKKTRLTGKSRSRHR